MTMMKATLKQLKTRSQHNKWYGHILGRITGSMNKLKLTSIRY